MPQKNECPLCKRFEPEAAELGVVQRDEIRRLAVVRCPRCGTFKCDRFLIDDEPKGLPESEGLRLSYLARRATDAGNEPLVVRNKTWEEQARAVRRPRSGFDYFNATLLELARALQLPGRHTGLFYLGELAARVLLPTDALVVVVSQLIATGELGPPQRQSGAPFRMGLTMTEAGWARVGEMEHRRSGERPFVAMWFSDEMDEVYGQAIEPALIACGYDPPFRVDDDRHLEHPESLGALR